MKLFSLMALTMILNASPAPAQSISGLVIDVKKHIHVVGVQDFEEKGKLSTATLVTRDNEPNYFISCGLDEGSPTDSISSIDDDNNGYYYFESREKCEKVLKALVASNNIYKTKFVVNVSKNKIEAVYTYGHLDRDDDEDRDDEDGDRGRDRDHH